MPTDTNRVFLTTQPLAKSPSHFRLAEFANDDGLAMVHPTLLSGLEAFRARLCDHYSQEVLVRILDGIRTRSDNYRIARRLGWANQGGAVSRTSRHLTEYGGIAADIRALLKASGTPIPPDALLELAVDFFDFVRGGYEDAHIHVDQRNRAFSDAGFFP